MLNKEQALIVAFRGQEIEYRIQDTQDWLPVGPAFIWENAGSVQFRVKPVVRYENALHVYMTVKLVLLKHQHMLPTLASLL